MKDELTDAPNDSLTIIKYILIFATSVVKLINSWLNKEGNNQKGQPPPAEAKHSLVDNEHPK